MLIALCLFMFPWDVRVMTPERPTPMELKNLLEEVAGRAMQVSDRLIAARLRSRVAAMMWSADQTRARALFTELWQLSGDDTIPVEQRDRLRREILRNLIRCDRQLADQWMKEVMPQSPSGRLTMTEQLQGRSPEAWYLNSLSESLADSDPQLASELLGRSFDLGYSFRAQAALHHLTDRAPETGLRLAGQVLAGLGSQPLPIAMAGARMMIDYCHPAGGESRNSETVQLACFNTGLLILRRSLIEETPPGNAAGDLRALRAHQAMLATALRMIAERRGMPVAAELLAISERLAANIPPELAGWQHSLATRLAGAPNPGREADKALLPAQFVEKGEISSLISRGEYGEALSRTMLLNDAGYKLLLLGRIARSAAHHGETQFAIYILRVISEASSSMSCTSSTSEALLSTLAIDRRGSLDDQLITCLNSQEDDADYYWESGALRASFGALAQQDWPRARRLASLLKSPLLEISATLAACEGIINTVRHQNQ